MSQETFNKIVTIVLFTFFMAMYAVSFFTGKSVDWQMLLTFLVPTLNHIMHQYAQSKVSVATIQANGFTTAPAATAKEPKPIILQEPPK